MDIADLIRELEQAPGPSRDLDVALAIFLGYRRHVEQAIDPKSGEQTRRSFWVHPGGKDPSRVPAFTASLDDAYLLAQTVAPGVSGGASWDGACGTARVGDSPYCFAANPPMALCIAVLKTNEGYTE
ncbi:hypothetical protein CN059_31915 [Sinorhizobium medicae]|uniref:Uncharacterized protein n=1 Tax=Sinorhizobium medicae TaxID=110321 RepID=A0ABX4TVM8_9HYPH|nr:hypothetical protein BMJ33_00470 [Sinorhizobium medicae]PLU81404.1 hypothetical protein BMJ19_02700 [Sinorhizobium medicae]RVQ38919.1 hypothetical protein CN059_31915 [Sinorhizobium medicae]